MTPVNKNIDLFPTLSMIEPKRGEKMAAEILNKDVISEDDLVSFLSPPFT